MRAGIAGGGAGKPVAGRLPTRTATGMSMRMTVTWTPAVVPAEHSTHPDPHLTQVDETLPDWQRGQVAWFNAEKGFGYLTSATGDAVFVDYRTIDMPGYKTLSPGQAVVFTLTHTCGGPEATQVLPFPYARDES
ncbi:MULTISPECIES: cold shock domain-containing protein [Nocardia]|uniref:cold shock domain-containing protein n=1 Tax=Nocardia TaxID=1817 RepID=UPI000AF75B77|nr:MULTISPECIES: cold shock domain-containing protein [Nocardia]